MQIFLRTFINLYPTWLRCSCCTEYASISKRLQQQKLEASSTHLREKTKREWSKREIFLQGTFANWLEKWIRVLSHKCTTKQNTLIRSRISPKHFCSVLHQKPNSLCLHNTVCVSFPHRAIWEQSFTNCPWEDDRMCWLQERPRTYKFCKRASHPNSNHFARSQLFRSHLIQQEMLPPLSRYLSLIIPCLSKAEVWVLPSSSPLGFCLIKACRVNTRS